MAYGTLALCPSCQTRRSTVGKGQVLVLLSAGPVVDVLGWVATAHAQAEAPSAP